VHRAVEHAHVGAGIDEITARGFVRTRDAGTRIGWLAGELADDFLQQVLQRDDALDVAVFIDDKGGALAAALELHQLLVQRRGFGHEIRLVQQGFEGRGRQRRGIHLRDKPLDMQQADHVVDRLAVDGQARVAAAADGGDDPVPVIREVDADHLALGDHDVLDGDLAQFQHAHHDLVALARQERTGFREHRAQFLDGQVVTGAVLRAHAQQAQHAVGKKRDECD